MNESQQEAFNKAMELLSEHFDTSQMFVSWVDDDENTFGFDDGRGNVFARRDQLSTWLCRSHLASQQDT